MNEAVGAWQWSPVQFNPQISAADFDDEAGFALTFPVVTGPFVTRNQAPRNTPTWNLDDNFSWLKGSHSLTFGGSYTQIHHIQNSLDVVPGISLGFDNTNDPSRGLFVASNNVGGFNGGPSGTTVTQARDIYGLLTGRVLSINGTARLNAAGDQYVYNGNLHQESKMGEIGLYAQDSWKLSPTLTLNYGMRWDTLVPFTTITPNWTRSTVDDLCGPSGSGNGPHGRECNLFNPGVFNNPTQIPTYTVFEPGTPGYQINYKNFAPNVGIAWRPNVQSGFMRKVLGDPEQVVLRAAFSQSFNQPRMDEFTGLFGTNPGGTAPGGAVRGIAAGNFALYPGGTGTAPLLLSDTSNLGPPAFVQSPTYPITASLASNNDIAVFTQGIKIPYVRTWSLGISRPIGRDTVIDLRYTGNQAKNSWDTENWNLENITENGFLQEFKLAQANLQSHVAAGCGTTGNPACSFAYTGAGTNPLPHYLAYMVGAGDPSSTAAYTGTNWTSSTLLNQLDTRDPNPYGAAASLWGGGSGQFRVNAANAGLPSNYFVLNPLVDDANITRNVEGSYYHSFTVEARRRLSKGLLVQGSYVYAQRFAASIQNNDYHNDFEFFRSTSTPPHTYKVLWTYQLPFGRGQRWGTNMNRWMDGALGGWEWSGTGRVQQNIVRFRGLIVGMSAKDVQDNFKIRYSTDNQGRTTVFSMPQDIIDESRKAFDTSATSATGFGSDGAPSGKYLAPAGGPNCFYLNIGDCGEQEYYFKLPLFARVDMTLKKKFNLTNRTQFSVQFDVLNVFDNVNFNHNFNPGGSWQVTSAYTDPNGSYDPGGRLGQLVFRFNW